MAECSLKLAWDIKKDRHAALVMINANRHEIEFEGCLHNFIRDKSELAKKAFVTKVYRCSAYARLITDRGRSGQVYVGFKGNNFIAADTTPTLVSSDGVDQAWQTVSHAGDWITGRYQAMPPPYTPLATLRQISPKGPTTGYRNMTLPETSDEEGMEDYVLPWGTLDEEGNEFDPDDPRAYLDA
jgi:hypothetical protein